MSSILRTIALRLALCLLLIWGAHRQFGLAGMVTASAFLGLALARPIIDLVIELFSLQPDMAPRVSFGRRAIRTLHDADDRLHLSLDDTRRIVGAMGSNALFRSLYADDLVERRRKLYLTPAALARHLARTSTPETGRFVLWLKNEPLLRPKQAPPVDRPGVTPSPVPVSVPAPPAASG